MINGISSATSGLRAAMTRFERAAGAISTGGDALDASGSESAPAATDLVGAQVEMESARLAFSASLIALRASTDLVADAISLGGYDVPSHELR